MYIEVGTRQSGKTYRLVNTLIDKLLLMPTTHKFCVLVHNHATGIGIRGKIVTEICSRMGGMYNRVGLTDKVNRQIKFISNVDQLRGHMFGSIYIDEFDFIDPDLIHSAIITSDPPLDLYATSTIHNGDGLRALGVNSVDDIVFTQDIDMSARDVTTHWLSPEHDDINHNNVLLEYFKLRKLVKFKISKHEFVKKKVIERRYGHGVYGRLVTVDYNHSDILLSGLVS